MFEGSHVALVTPMTEGGAIDFDALRELIEWHVEEGTDGIVLCGTTGESPTVSFEEQKEMWRVALEQSGGRVLILAGTGSNDTRAAVERTAAARDLGVDGSLQILPYYNRPTPDGVYAHFEEIDRVGLPYIVYHNPVRTGLKLPVRALNRIAELPFAAAVKESTGDMDYVMELLQISQKPVLCGDDTLTLAMMACGAAGVISVASNVIPRQYNQMVRLLQENRIAEARELNRKLHPIFKALTLEVNPQCVKYAMSCLGRCSPRLRLPLIEPQEGVKRQIELMLTHEQMVKLID